MSQDPLPHHCYFSADGQPGCHTVAEHIGVSLKERYRTALEKIATMPYARVRAERLAPWCDDPALTVKRLRRVAREALKGAE